ncbi:MAG: ABC transporter ATP-binding protein/permease [Actinomycetota bacterium]|nr:ABC transporter ATP-binding protein/permease [Actinomycetota bacterium]
MSLADGARLLRHHLRPHYRALWHLAAWSALEAVPAFVAGLAVANAIDRGFLAGRPLVGFGLLAALAVLYVIGAVGTRQVYPWLAAAIEPLRDSLVTAVITASLRRAIGGEAGAGGSGVVQATVQVETVRALFSTLLRNTRQLLIASIAALGGLTVLSPLLALVVGSFVLLALLLFGGLLRILVVRYRAVVLLGERVGASAAPVTEGMRDVVALGAQERAAREVGEVIDAEAEAVRAFARAWVLRVPVLALGAHLPLLALLALSPWLLAGGHLTVGQIAGGAVYLFSGLQPAIQALVSTGGTVLVNLGVVLGRLAEVCAEPPAPVATPAGPRPERHDVDVARVTFAYSPHAEPVIRGLTLEIPEGLHLAVVGPSGVGKSTLANLLARLTTPQRGELRLGGSLLAKVDEHHLRRTVALIPQEAYVFAGTVRDNLVYLQPQATAAELDEAVAAVGLEETISHLGGYDAEIEPGGDILSPGQRQLIALARVFLSPARVIILDEATCHLDPVAEARAEHAFAERHGTLIVIAHRISSALRADRILVMDGEQTTIGSHENLLDQSTLYAELVGHWWHGAQGGHVDTRGDVGRAGARSRR